jgi:hypothetical protein
MSLPHLRAGAVAVAVAALAGVVVWQHYRAQPLITEGAALREQLAQVVVLHGENERLREALNAAAERSEKDKRDLIRLRAQVGTLRQLEQENERLKTERDRSTNQVPQPQTEANPYDIKYGQGATARLRHGMRWGLALISYVSEDQKKFPASLQEVARLLANDEEAAGVVPTADKYEILYHGRLADMTNPPPEGAIILREKQPWLTTDGQWARAYVWGDGKGMIHTEPDGNFDRWESPRMPKINPQ